MRYGICGTVNKRYDMTHRHFLRGLLLVLLSVWGMKAESARIRGKMAKSRLSTPVSLSRRRACPE